MLKKLFDLPKKDFLEMIQLVARMAEFSDWDNGDHLERTRRYTLILATELGLSPYEVEIISQASVLHDVGMVGVSSEVWHKTDELTPFEWEQVERHPMLGASLLKGSNSPILQMGETIALTHHERWDGSGYPHGLVGEEIPLAGRICAVVDVFDALTTSRPYNELVSADEALELLRESSGTLFDPAVFDAFERVFPDIVKTKETFD
jgi:putative two-component system response regulator